eukprot:382581-Pleurochrysis_carterae.AAC.1
MLRCACDMQNGHGGLPRERLFRRQLGLSALSVLSVASIELASSSTSSSALRTRANRFTLNSTCSRVCRLRKPLASKRARSRCVSAFFRSAAASAFALACALSRVYLSFARAAASIFFAFLRPSFSLPPTHASR